MFLSRPQDTLSGEQIAERREALGLSAHWLARRAGVSPSTIHRIEQGEARSDPEKLRAVADALVEAEVTATSPGDLADLVQRSVLAAFTEQAVAERLDRIEAQVGRIEGQVDVLLSKVA